MAGDATVRRPQVRPENIGGWPDLFDTLDVILDKNNDVAVIPLWSERENHGVLVTSIENSTDALKAALAIEKLRQRFPEPRRKKEKMLIEECIALFKRFDFKRSYQIAQQEF